MNQMLLDRKPSAKKSRKGEVPAKADPIQLNRKDLHLRKILFCNERLSGWRFLRAFAQ